MMNHGDDICRADEIMDQRDAETVIDIDEALRLTAGDRGMLREMGMLFLQEAPRQRQAILTQIEAGDAAGIRQTTHTLKGSVVIFGARSAAAAAAELENAAADDDASKLTTAWQRLNLEMDRLIDAVQQLCRR
jgi:HPt (histidine-containing phosphotransfer) domain-containing protein